jgi:hypothetical protein
MNDNQELIQTEDDEETGILNPKVYFTYKRRWFYLFIVCLAQISNSLVR